MESIKIEPEKTSEPNITMLKTIFAKIIKICKIEGLQ
jgi:hypothetical protein